MRFQEKEGRQMKLSTKKAITGMSLVAPLLAGCILFYAYPLIQVFIRSITSGIGSMQKYVGLEHYEGMLSNTLFLRASKNTFRFLILALPLILILSLWIALTLKSGAKKHPWLKSILLSPYVMPVAGTVMLIEHLFASTGLVNKSLYALGLPVADWLNSQWALPVMLLLYLWKNTGYAVILLVSGLNTIPTQQYDSASIDGASKFKQLWHITLPQMWYSFFFATVFSLINAFKCFREIFLLGGTHPHDSIYMLQHFINNAFEKMSYNKLAVASITLLVAVSVVFVLFYRVVMRKEAYKG